MSHRLPFDYAARNLMRSPSRCALSVSGSMLVVLLVISAAAFINGMNQSLRVSGAGDNVILLGAGSEESIERSEIGAQVPGIVAASVRGIRTELNVPFVSPEIHLALTVGLNEDDDSSSLAVLRGFTPEAFLVHRQVRVIEGRPPRAGQDEVMLGQLVASKLDVEEGELGVGASIWIDGRAWTISGLFEAPNTVMDAEIWCPLSDLQIVAQRDSLSCLVLTLEPGRDIGAVEVFAAQRLDLELAAMTEDEYYASLVEFFKPIRMLVMLTAGLIALGGLIGGLNTMYAAFASRVREIGSLQVLGYRRSAIIFSLLQESLLTSAIGAVLAIGLGVVLLDGIAIRFSMGAFGLLIDHGVILTAILAAIILGIIGALPPAVRCLRLPIPEALKSG